MKPEYTLFMGRFQPFHIAHEALIRKEYDKGNNIVIGIRDTGYDEDNPYDVEKRRRMIRQVFPDKKRVKIMKLPNITKIAYGRKVGYKIERIKLSKKLEKISATNIRNSDHLDNRTN